MTPEEKEGRDGAWSERDDRAIEESLWRNAHGYDVEETVEEECEKTGRKTRVRTHHVPGDVRAQIFWLQNRKPETWRQKPCAAKKDEVVKIVDDIPE